MKVTAILTASVIATGTLLLPTSIQAQDRDRTSREDSWKGEMHVALDHLKQARRHLAEAGSGFGGLRADAMEQTQYAITQVYAVLGDREAEAKDRETADRLAREAKENVRKRDADDPINKDAVRKAVDELKKAKTALQGDEDQRRGVHRDKAINFVNYAIKEAEEGLKAAK